MCFRVKLVVFSSLPAQHHLTTFRCKSRFDFFLPPNITGVSYSTRVSPQTCNRMVESARFLLNKLLPDVFIYADHVTGPESGDSSPSHAHYDV
jgi:RNA 3'-terminal phosphate cyclase